MTATTGVPALLAFYIRRLPLPWVRHGRKVQLSMDALLHGSAAVGQPKPKSRITVTYTACETIAVLPVNAVPICRAFVIPLSPSTAIALRVRRGGKAFTAAT